MAMAGNNQQDRMRIVELIAIVEYRDLDWNYSPNEYVNFNPKVINKLPSPFSIVEFAQSEV
jgi:hypothetical protein